MTASPRPRDPSADPEQWQTLNRLLDEVLELAPGLRVARLEELAGRFPKLESELRRLVRCAGDESTLDRALVQALEFVAGGDSMPAHRRIGPWRLLSLIGHGGMAQVFLAERADGAYRQQVALKLIWPGLAAGEGIDRFARERQILAEMDDPRIARLLDGGVTADGRPWLAMEYVRGESIVRHCRRRKLGLRARLELFCQVTGAVASAHRRLVIHGDLKPANVLVAETEDGSARVKLLDFGIARLLADETGQRGSPEPSLAAQTPRFASPEQRAGRRITTASDVFQLGGLLREVLEGLPTTRNPEAIVERAMADDPEARYPGADAMEADLRASLEHRPLAARSGGRGYRLRCFLARHRLGAAATMTALILLVTAMGLYVDQARKVAAEAEVHRAVLAFLEDMLYAGDPYRGGGHPPIPASVLDDAAARVERDLSEQPRVQARLLNVLGQVSLSRGEGGVALERLHRAREIAGAHGLDAELTHSRAGIAAVSIWAGGYGSAEQTLRTVLAERVAREGPASQVVAQTRLSLADLLHSRGFYDAALAEAQAALASGYHPSWAHRVLGMILRDAGRFRESGEHLERSLELDRSRLGPVHANLATGLEHHVQLLLHTGRASSAREAIGEAFHIRQTLLGEDWEGLIWTRHWLGLVAFVEGDFQTAGELLERTVRDYRESFSEESHLLAFARSDLAWVELALGRPGTAATLFRQALDGLEPVQPGDHPRIAEPLLGLAGIALARGDPESARALAGRGLAVRRQFLAPDHPWIGSGCGLYRLAGGRCEETMPRGDLRTLDQARMTLVLGEPVELSDQPPGTTPAGESAPGT